MTTTTTTDPLAGRPTTHVTKASFTPHAHEHAKDLHENSQLVELDHAMLSYSCLSSGFPGGFQFRSEVMLMAEEPLPVKP